MIHKLGQPNLNSFKPYTNRLEPFLAPIRLLDLVAELAFLSNFCEARLQEIFKKFDTDRRLVVNLI